MSSQLVLRGMKIFSVTVNIINLVRIISNKSIISRRYFIDKSILFILFFYSLSRFFSLPFTLKVNLVFILVKLVEFLQMETPVYVLITDNTHDLIIASISITCFSILLVIISSYCYYYGSTIINYSIGIFKLLFLFTSIALSIIFLLKLKHSKVNNNKFL